MFQTFEIKKRLRKNADKIGCLLSKIEKNAEYCKFIDEYNSISENEKIHIVVSGNWSTGKSKIVKALTGNENIGISADVKTTESEIYDYKDYCVVDTPGLNSLVDSHKKETQKALYKSDRIIYCITSGQLFSDQTMQDFIDIINLVDKNNKIILAITKFGEEGGNNPLDTMINIRMQIEDDLLERNIDSDRYVICFINAELYIEGKKINNDDMIDASYFKEFMDIIENPTDNSLEFACINKCKRQAKLIIDFIEHISGEIRKSLTDDEQLKFVQARKEEQEKNHKKCRELKHRISSDINDIYYHTVNELISGIPQTLDDIEPYINEKLNELIILLGDEVSVYESQSVHIYDDKPYPKRNGIFSFFKKINNKGKDGFFKTTGQIAEKSINTINKLAQPVQTGTKRTMTHPFNGEAIMSEIGGEGTLLATKIEKVFPTKGTVLAQKIGTISSKLEKFSGFLAIGGFLLDTTINVVSSVKENSDIKKLNSLKIQLKGEIQSQLSEIKQTLCEIVDIYAKSIEEKQEYDYHFADKKLNIINELYIIKRDTNSITDNLDRRNN